MFKTTNTSNRKIHIRTLLMFLLSLLVTCGGWFFTKQLLKYKEAQLFTKSGQLQVADSGYSLMQEEGAASNIKADTGKDESDVFHEETLSEDQMAQILAAWESDSGLLSHEPQKGQMNMEQAIYAGIAWITEMSQPVVLCMN